VGRVKSCRDDASATPSRRDLDALQIPRRIDVERAIETSGLLGERLNPLRAGTTAVARTRRRLSAC
jgi:putative ubiquitin-RnfH superfamily antitoxin RatB of RatAB toxin-antitoxin module